MAEETQKIIQLWRAIDRVIHAEYHDQARRHDLTLEQFHLLLDLGGGSFAREDEAPTVGHIAGCAGQAPHTMTDRIKRLEKKGLVTKMRDAADQRICRIEITLAGRELIQKIMAQAGGDFLINALDGMETMERRTLRQSLGGFLAALVETAIDDGIVLEDLHPLIGLKKHQ